MCAADVCICSYVPATDGMVVVTVVIVLVLVLVVVVVIVVVVVVVVVGFRSAVLHSVVVTGSLGELTALLTTVAIRTSIVVLVIPGSGMLFAKVTPSVITSVEVSVSSLS